MTNNQVVTANLELPDNTTAKVAAKAKVFSSGKNGYFTQLAVTIGGKLYGGQLMLYERNA